MPEQSIQFDEEQETRRGQQPNESSSFSLIALVQKYGLASDERSANIVLSVIMELAILATVAIFMLGRGGSATITPSQQAQMDKIEQAQRASQTVPQP